jgi:ectoine hydroxylase-related dioxygenase (phytanoyl-CoA dioxygenase family)
MNNEFAEQGCVLPRALLTAQDLAPISSAILSAIRVYLPEASSIQDPDWVRTAIDRPDIVTAIYNQLRDNSLLLQLGQNPKITKVVKTLIDAPVIYHKIPLRIDVPFESKELAFWHQDDFYVQGNECEVTVWIPLQDTFAHTGALSVMKGSFLQGAIPHTYKVGKKTLPTGVFDVPINIVEMNKGDVLFFSSYLVHSSNLNISDQIRYSIQLRYSAASAGAQSSLMRGYTHVEL